MGEPGAALDDASRRVVRAINERREALALAAIEAGGLDGLAWECRDHGWAGDSRVTRWDLMRGTKWLGGVTLTTTETGLRVGMAESPPEVPRG